MGRVLLCVGKYAVNPFYFEKACVRVYSMEELCYYLHENAFLLETDLVSRKLVKWIDEECELAELANSLYSYVNAAVSVKAFAAAILEYVGFYPKEEIAVVERALRENAGLTNFEKKKARADFLLEKKKYVEAMTSYHDLILQINQEETGFKAKIFHNYAVCLVRMFMFSRAGEYFMKAYELGGNPESYREYLAIRKIQMKETDYIHFLSEHPESYEESLKLEGSFEKAMLQWQNSEQYLKLEDIRKDKRQDGSYYHQLEELVEIRKDEYREQVHG